MQHRYRLALSAASTLVALATAMPVFAQDSADGSIDDIIVTAQRRNQTAVTRSGSVGALGNKAAEDVPFSIKSYNEALILNQQPQSLGQVLENDPSIRTTYGFGNAAEVFVIRGFPLFSDDVGIDGLYGIAPRQLIAPELYDSVQVINGASAFLNGAAPGGSGLGGSVNLIPKRASRDLTRVTANWQQDEHFGGSFDAARRFGTNREWGVRINGVARTGDLAVDGEFRSAYTLGGGFDYNRGPLRISLDLGYQRIKIRGLRHKVSLATNAIPDVPRASANYSQPWTYSKLRDVFGIAKIEYDMADNAMLYASVGARDGMEKGIYGGITVNDAETGAATGTGLYVPRTDNNEAAQAGLRVKLAAGGITHEVNVGGTISWQVNRNAFDFLTSFSTNLYDAVPIPLPISSFAGGNLDDPQPQSRYRLWSVFASDTIGLWDDHILVTAGLRLQTVDQKTYTGLGGPATDEYNESAVTPVFGLVVKPVEGLSLFANRIEGFQVSDAAPAQVSGAPVLNAGEIFAPVRTKQYEVGAKLTVGPINGSLAAFQIDKPITGAVASTTVPGAVVYGNFGEQRNRGIEFSVDGEVTQGLRVIAGGSVISAKYHRSLVGFTGNKYPGVPDLLLNANVEWDLPFVTGLTLTGRGTYTGDQAANDANTLELPSWTRFDVGARFVTVVADKALTLRFNVDNVANKRYWASAFQVFNPDLLQGAPRTFKASASIEF